MRAANLFFVLSLVGCWYLVRHRRMEGERIGLELAVGMIWVLIALSRPVSLWFQGQLSEGDALPTVEEGSPINRTIAFAMLIAGTLILLKRNGTLSEFIAENQLLVCLYLYCLVSIIWSDVPFVAFKRWFRHLGTIVFALVILTDRRGFKAVVTTFRYAAYILLPLSIVLIKYFPRLGRSYHPHSGVLGISGVTTNKNQLGLLCLISALFLLFEIHNQWISGNRRSWLIKGDVCLFAAAVWLLFVSHSATSLFAFYGGAITYWALGRKRMQKARSPWMFMLILAFTVLVPAAFYGVGFAGADTSAGSFVDVTGHSETFWGRTVLWKEVIDRVSNPLLGCGYETFWIGDRMQELWDLYWWQPTEAHNGFVGVYANLGLVGVSLLIWLFVQTYYRLFRLFAYDPQNEYARAGLTCLTVALLYNVTEYSFLGLQNSWLIVLLVSIRLSSARAEVNNVLEPSPAAAGSIST